MNVSLGSFEPERVTDYLEGTVAVGHVGPDNAPVWVCTPNEYSPEDGSKDFVAAIGLLARPEQYLRLGQVLMSDNDRLVVFGHDHHHHKWPIRANAADIIAGVHELELEHFTAIGHSMGTLAVLLAMEDEEFASSTDMVVQSDPAMTGSHLAYGIKDIYNMGREATILSKKYPKDAFRYAASAIGEYWQRPLVIGNQVLRLASGKVHGRYNELMLQHPDKKFTIIFNHNDGLVPENWNESLRGPNLVVYIHDSVTGLAHAAINVDEEVGHAVHALAHNQKAPDSFHLIYDGTQSKIAA